MSGLDTLVPLDLLWKAWPDGYLDMRGVATINYGICFGKGLWIEAESMCSSPTVAVLPYEARFSENAQAGPDDTQACLEAGYFLPRVDPTDQATWACLLLDLAEAAGVTHSLYGTGFQWSHDAEAGMWTLDYCGEQGLSFAIDTDNHATALVLAIAQVRSSLVETGATDS